MKEIQKLARCINRTELNLCIKETGGGVPSSVEEVEKIVQTEASMISGLKFQLGDSSVEEVEIISG